MTVLLFVLPSCTGEGPNTTAATGATAATDAVSTTNATDATNATNATNATDATTNATTDATTNATSSTSETGSTGASAEDIPYYFIAIHNEPHPELGGMIAQHNALQSLIAKADEHDIKLTLMFGTSWVDFLLDENSPDRQQALQAWRDKGHEISTHHHSDRHPGFFDGYSYKPQEIVELIRQEVNSPYFNGEKYIGDLADFSTLMYELNSEMKSGCLNEREDKRRVADNFTILTCSAFPNSDDDNAPAPLEDFSPYKGVNDYVNVTEYAGKTRFWLGHSHLMTDKNLSAVKDVFSGLEGGAYGVVTHSLIVPDIDLDQVTPMNDFMDYLAQVDPGASRSVTLSQIVEDKLLPERIVEDITIFDNIAELKCPDGECGPAEQQDPELCPQDCQ